MAESTSSRLQGETKEERSERMRQLARKRWDAKRNAPQDAGGNASSPDRGAAPGGMAAGRGRSSATDASRIDHAVVRELERKAQQGDIAAAKELREWRRLDPADSADSDAVRLAAIIVQLSSHSRDELRAWLAAQQGMPANEDNRQGTNDGFDALPAAGAEPVDATPADDEPLLARKAKAPHRETHVSEWAPSTDANGSHTPDGTAPPRTAQAVQGMLTEAHQMTVDDCIAEAEKE